MARPRNLALVLLTLILLAPTSAAEVAGFQGRDDGCGPAGDLGLWSCMASHVGVATLDCDAATCTLQLAVNSRGEGNDDRLRDRLHVFIDENGFAGGTTELCTAGGMTGAIGCDGAASFTIDVASQDCRSFIVTTRFTEAPLGQGHGDDSLLRAEVQTWVRACARDDVPRLVVQPVE